jgi:hypothetical protein
VGPAIGIRGGGGIFRLGKRWAEKEGGQIKTDGEREVNQMEDLDDDTTIG